MRSVLTVEHKYALSSEHYKFTKSAAVMYSPLHNHEMLAVLSDITTEQNAVKLNTSNARFVTAAR